MAISPVTFWEVAALARRGRVTLHRPPIEWLRDAVGRSATEVIGLTLEIAATAGSLESDVVRDPADRLIVATALHHGVPLVTRDHKIIASALVPTIW